MKRKIKISTPQEIRDFAREQFEFFTIHRESLALCIHVVVDLKYPGGTIYDECKVIGWRTVNEDEFLVCEQLALCTDEKDHLFTREFNVKNILSISHKYSSVSLFNNMIF